MVRKPIESREAEGLLPTGPAQPYTAAINKVPQHACSADVSSHLSLAAESQNAMSSHARSEGASRVCRVAGSSIAACQVQLEQDRDEGQARLRTDVLAPHVFCCVAHARRMRQKKQFGKPKSDVGRALRTPRFTRASHNGFR